MDSSPSASHTTLSPQYRPSRAASRLGTPVLAAPSLTTTSHPIVPEAMLHLLRAPVCSASFYVGTEEDANARYGAAHAGPADGRTAGVARAHRGRRHPGRPPDARLGPGAGRRAGRRGH